MTKPLHIAIAGLGTVGVGVIHILQQQAAMLAERVGRPLKLVAVSARDKTKNRGVDLADIRWVEDPTMLAHLPEADIVVELMGGSEGAAKILVESALAQGKSVVTANKALIAHHGLELARLAEAHQVALCFEAAVAGGIPIIKTMREGLAANRISRVMGILNGTCNYILTAMQQDSRDFAEVLSEAQAKGYAEADPSFDVDGIDTAHKLAILASLTFGTEVDFAQVSCEGIRAITAADVAFATELGYRIKLLGMAQMQADGRVSQSVHPVMLPVEAPLARVSGVCNGVVVHGDAIGDLFMEGRGAGAGPTASAVVADIMDIARGHAVHAFGKPVAQLMSSRSVPMEDMQGSYYLRIAVDDKSGVLAEVTGIFAQMGISLQSFLQHPAKDAASAQLIITTHQAKEAEINQAMMRIANLSFVHGVPQRIHIAS